MAIDANILIFERVREELKSWKKLEDAVRVWFKKSWSAIWDSNLTGFIVAMILYVFGINMIKGFWLMLWIWIIVSLFSAMYISRVFVLLLAEKVTNKNKFIGK
jgi:preprotein translocase subunit SecD